MSEVRFVVTGGSGFIGTNFMEWALSSKHTVSNFDIRPPKILNHQEKWKFVDIRDLKKFKEALVEFCPTHIIHLAATTGMDVHDFSFFDANTKGVENLVKATENISSLERIVFASSLLVCPNGYVPESDTEFNPPNLYGKSKVVGEKLVRNSDMKCSWVIVRPTSVWGPWFEHSYRTFFRLVDRGLYAQPGSKPIIKPLTFVGNTVHMLQTLVQYKGAMVDGGTYYLGDYPEQSIQKWADVIREKIGKKRNPVFPIPLMRFMALTGDLLQKLGWSEPPITNFRLNNMLTGSHYPIKKTEEIVGALPYSFEDSVYETLSWMFEHNLVKHKPIDRKLS